MTNFQILLESGMFFAEGIAAFIALVFFNKAKSTHYIYFCTFLIFIFACEMFGKFGDNFITYKKKYFFNYLVIPLEFIFFYWLYAYKSLKNKKIFYAITALFVLSYIPHELYYVNSKHVFSFNYTFGSFLLMFLVVLEYYKQINSENILHFIENKMFYINLGVTLFYIGTLPFWTFYFQIFEYKKIWNMYLIYFRITGITMYLLFASSFIWGKQNYS